RRAVAGALPVAHHRQHHRVEVLHVHRAAAPEEAVAQLTAERVDGPLPGVGRHHVQVSVHQQGASGWISAGEPGDQAGPPRDGLAQLGLDPYLGQLLRDPLRRRALRGGAAGLPGVAGVHPDQRLAQLHHLLLRRGHPRRGRGLAQRWRVAGGPRRADGLAHAVLPTSPAAGLPPLRRGPHPRRQRRTHVPSVRERRVPYGVWRTPLTRRGRRQGLSSRNAGGSSRAGVSWKTTGRWKRRIAVTPTEVWAEFVVAGHGPPWCIAQVTATPVGQPPTITRPALAVSRSITGPTSSASASTLACSVPVRLPGTASRPASSSAVEAYSTSSAAGPKHSRSSSSAWAVRPPALTASSCGAASQPDPAGAGWSSSSDRTPGTAASSALVRAYPSRMRALSNGPVPVPATASARRASSPCPAGRKTRPGLVQNCPVPSR